MTGPGPAPTEPLVVLVDEDDREIGSMAKLEAHRTGALHRAFSVFIFNSDGAALLQRRAAGKYHSAGLWTNSCCGHPSPGETLVAAATRRVKEELGSQIAPELRFHFRYSAVFDNGLIENEFDHVLFSISDERPAPDPLEVDAVRWVTPEELTLELSQHPERFTVWLRECLPEVAALRAAGHPSHQ
jgi:isopentenyl-diphosphate delta-isomerase